MKEKSLLTGSEGVQGRGKAKKRRHINTHARIKHKYIHELKLRNGDFTIIICSGENTGKTNVLFYVYAFRSICMCVCALLLSITFCHYTLTHARTHTRNHIGIQSSQIIDSESFCMCVWAAWEQSNKLVSSL